LPEPSSNARFGPAAISLYRHLVSGFAPAIERVFVYGHPTLSRPITALLSDPVREIVAVTLKPEWNDPGWAVSQVIPAAEMEPGDPAWLESWKRADAALRPLADELAGIALTGPRLATSLLGSLTKTDRLVLGPSSPIRDADIAPIGSTSPCVYSNRGLAGIDGVIATALGVATAPTSADGCSRTTALVGDLTALHDLTALAIPRLERRPTLRLIIADDHGGSIFSTLEYGAGRDIIGDFADDFGRLFTVPVDVDFPAAARAFGATARTVTTVEEFETALSEPIRDIEVIHARLAESPRRAWNEELASQGTDIVKNIVTPLLNGAGLPLSS
jgi:2-succinyl-5-enolpyruvyl-6-hydroxy-3-cyclohexene-1-carboxylate synthase